METKICKKCGIEKNINEFYLDKHGNKEYYRSICRNCFSEEKKNYYLMNKEKILRKVKNYREEHLEKISERKYKRKKQRLNEDPIYKLKQQMNNLIYYSFKRKRKYRQTSRAYKIFGCDWKTFYNHLLDTFKNNYGKDWTIENVEVDHIVPLSTAKTENEVIKLCYYTNLQLLTKEDNQRKGIKNNFTI